MLIEENPYEKKKYKLRYGGERRLDVTVPLNIAKSFGWESDDELTFVPEEINGFFTGRLILYKEGQYPDFRMKYEKFFEFAKEKRLKKLVKKLGQEKGEEQFNKEWKKYHDSIQYKNLTKVFEESNDLLQKAQAANQVFREIKKISKEITYLGKQTITSDAYIVKPKEPEGGNGR